jgi:hypothetical protein
MEHIWCDKNPKECCCQFYNTICLIRCNISHDIPAMKTFKETHYNVKWFVDGSRARQGSQLLLQVWSNKCIKIPLEITIYTNPFNTILVISSEMPQNSRMPLLNYPQAYQNRPYLMFWLINWYSGVYSYFCNEWRFPTAWRHRSTSWSKRTGSSLKNL